MEILALDHIYLSVSDMRVSEPFYDRVMQLLGFLKGDKQIGGDPHAHYFNRVLQLSIRPAKSSAAHDAYAPGLHHLCLQLPTRADVDEAAAALLKAGVSATEPKLYPEYNPEYYATFFTDPDGIRLELMNRTSYRDGLVNSWDQFETFLNPVAELLARKAAQADETK